MSDIESSPGTPRVRRSNSYRVALRKSGVPKEYIDELEQIHLNDLHNRPNGNSNHNNHNNNNNNGADTKKPLFKRNFRGLHNKQRINAHSDDTTERREATIAMEANSAAVRNHKQLALNDDKDDETEPMTSAHGANYAAEGSRQRVSRSTSGGQTEQQSVCGHMLCVICCCNYCCFLPSSVRRQLRQESSHSIK